MVVVVVVTVVVIVNKRMSNLRMIIAGNSEFGLSVTECSTPSCRVHISWMLYYNIMIYIVKCSPSSDCAAPPGHQNSLYL